MVSMKGGEGQSVVELKAWSYGVEAGENAPLVTWELRRFADIVGLCLGSLYLHQWIRKNKGVWSATFERFELRPQAALIPSNKSFRQCPPDGALEQPELVRGEWSITTEGILVLLLHISSDARLQAHKSSSYALLASWVCMLANGICSRALAGSILDPDQLRSCQVGQADGVCFHMLSVHSVAGQDFKEQGVQQHLIPGVLRQLYKGSHQCCGCLAILKHMIGVLSFQMGATLQQKGHNDLKRGSTNDPSNPKRARKGEDMKASFLEKGAQVNQSVSLVAAVDGSVPPRTAAHWPEQLVCSHQSAGWLHFAQARSITICMDAKRLGNPGEDTEMLLATNNDSRRATWLPPQAIWRWALSHTSAKARRSFGGGLCRPKPLRRTGLAKGALGASCIRVGRGRVGFGRGGGQGPFPARSVQRRTAKTC